MSENLLSGINKTKTIKEIVKTPEWSKQKYPNFRESPEFKRNNTGYAGLNFDGVDDYVNAGNAASLNITTAITIGAWVLPRGAYSTLANPSIVRKQNNYVLRYASANGNLAGIVYIAGVAKLTPELPAEWDILNWNHYVVTYDNSNLRLYKNGTERGIATVQVGNIDTTADAVGLGGSGNGVNPIRGQISGIRIWNRALSASEVQQLYNGGFVDLTGLVLWHDYKSGSAKDLSGNNNDGVLNNGPIYV